MSDIWMRRKVSSVGLTTAYRLTRPLYILWQHFATFKKGQTWRAFSKRRTKWKVFRDQTFFFLKSCEMSKRSVVLYLNFGVMWGWIISQEKTYNTRENYGRIFRLYSICSWKECVMTTMDITLAAEERHETMEKSEAMCFRDFLYDSLRHKKSTRMTLWTHSKHYSDRRHHDMTGWTFSSHWHENPLIPLTNRGCVLKKNYEKAGRKT